MKKFISLILCVVLCVCLVACGSNNSNAPKEDIAVSGDGAEPSTEAIKGASEAMAEAGKTAGEAIDEAVKETADGVKYTENGVITSDVDYFVFNFETPLSLVCTSGAGAWSDDLTLAPDGQFYGSYHDSDMGDTGEGYPNGTHYLCEYWGFVTDVEQTSDYTYACKIDGVATQNEPDTEEIEEGMLFKYTKPESLVNGNEYVLYMPNTPVSELPEGAKSWIVPLEGEFKGETIGRYIFYSLSDERAYWTIPGRE